MGAVHAQCLAVVERKDGDASKAKFFFGVNRVTGRVCRARLCLANEVMNNVTGYVESLLYGA